MGDEWRCPDCLGIHSVEHNGPGKRKWSGVWDVEDQLWDRVNGEDSAGPPSSQAG